MEYPIAEQARQAEKMLHDLEMRIREDVSTGRNRQDEDTQQAFKDLFTVMVSLISMDPFFGMMLMRALVPLPGGSTVTGHTGTSTTINCPNCSYLLTITLIP